MNKITSFTQEVKEEICSTFDIENEAVTSLLSAFIRCNGTLSFKNRQTCLFLESENAKTIKFIYSCLKVAFNDVLMHFSFHKVMNLNKNIRYVIEIEDASRVIEDLEINFLESKIAYSLTDKESKIKYYLAGLFLASGSVNDPTSSNYHLEMSVKDEAFAKAIVKLTNKIKTVNFNFKMIARRNNYVVYIKKSDLISDFLAFIDTNESCMKFENVRIDRDFNNVANRLINCDAYNYKKTMDISNKQISYIKFLDEKIGLDNIQNEKLKTLCKLRLELPEASYGDLATTLGEKLGTNVSKSNVSHLFRKIEQMAIEYNYESR